MRESLPSWKGSYKALRGCQIVALAVCERQNGPYSKPTSLLDSLSTLLNREPFQDLNWGGWGWVMVYGILCFSGAPVKSPVTINSFEKRQNGICRDKYGVASRLLFFLIYFFYHASPFSIAIFLPLLVALLTVYAVSRHRKCSKKLLRLYCMSLYNHESQQLESWLPSPEVRSSLKQTQPQILWCVTPH